MGVKSILDLVLALFPEQCPQRATRAYWDASLHTLEINLRSLVPGRRWPIHQDYETETRASKAAHYLQPIRYAACRCCKDVAAALWLWQPIVQSDGAIIMGQQLAFS